MFVAQKLRQQNIIGYVIYMFQVEDVIRAYDLDIERICQEYLPRFHYDDEAIPQVREWYEGLIRMMREEGAQTAGHVQVVRNTIILLADRHQELLHDPKEAFYSAAYYKALPFIVELRGRGAQHEKNEIENCLDAVYGATLLRMQNREISPQTQQALAPITHLLEMLSERWKTRDLDPENEY